LIERIAIHPAEHGVEIELVGEVAHMVAFANGDAQSKKAAPGGAACGDAYGSVKAGCGGPQPALLAADPQRDFPGPS
jgi:hypothetical protein